MNVTQKQIAEHLGVSQSLVTQALRDLPKIPESTRRKVQEAARQLGYGAQSNSSARMLRARRGGTRTRTHAIAILMGDFFEGLPLHEVPFFKRIFKGFAAAADLHGVELLYSPSLNRIPRIMTEGSVDGAICLYSGATMEKIRETPPPCPVIAIGDGAPGERVLRPDDCHGTLIATRHLMDLGHRDIAYLGDLVGSVPDLFYRSRMDGYFQALKEGGITVRNQLVEAHIGSPDAQAGAAGMARLLGRCRAITAVVCLNDTVAMGAIAELTRHGLRVPEDISVTGFDDVWGDYGGEPALTTIFFDRFAMGQRGVEAICEAADGKASTYPACPASGHELLPVRLVERASTASVRAA